MLLVELLVSGQHASIREAERLLEAQDSGNLSNRSRLRYGTDGSRYQRASEETAVS